MQGGGFGRRQRRAMILQAGHNLELDQSNIHMTIWIEDGCLGSDCSQDPGR